MRQKMERPLIPRGLWGKEHAPGPKHVQARQVASGARSNHDRRWAHDSVAATGI
jgi:hypothetical protein